MTEFFETRMGHAFYEHTVPELVRQITRLNVNLERLVEAVARNPETTRSSKHTDDHENDHS